MFRWRATCVVRSVARVSERGEERKTSIRAVRSEGGRIGFSLSPRGKKKRRQDSSKGTILLEPNVFPPRSRAIARLLRLPTPSIETGQDTPFGSMRPETVRRKRGQRKETARRDWREKKAKAEAKNFSMRLDDGKRPAIVRFRNALREALALSQSKTPTHLPCTSKQSRSKAPPVGEGATPSATLPAVPVAVVAVVAAPPAAPPAPPPLLLSSAISPNPTGADGVSGVSSDAKNSEKGDACMRW